MNKYNPFLILANKSNQINSIGREKRSLLFSSIEENYGINLNREIILCNDFTGRETARIQHLSNMFKIVNNKTEIESKISSVNADELELNSVNDLIKMIIESSNSESNFNLKNLNWDFSGQIIPIISIIHKDKSYYFRLDHPVILRIMYDTESLLCEKINKDQFDRQKEYANKYFNVLFKETEIDVYQ